ncbi:MAG: ERF family protein, partial [Caulobacterales bacterium]
MPKVIVKAISAVQSTVEAVAKTQFNKMGGYKFASADDIYAAVTRRMGQVGLVIMPLELEPPQIERIEREGKTAQWARFRFGFLLAVDDETWFDERSSRTLFIQLLGPQTFNAAESYAQKQFLRGLLKLPTGDLDLDSMPQAETLEDQAA